MSGKSKKLERNKICSKRNAYYANDYKRLQQRLFRVNFSGIESELKELLLGKLLLLLETKNPAQYLSRAFWNGARRFTVDEPLCWIVEYPVEWRKPRQSLAELAKLRWEDGLGVREIAKRLGRSHSSVSERLSRWKGPKNGRRG